MGWAKVGLKPVFRSEFMKLSAGKLKGMNFKKILLNHGEKVGLGVVCLLTMFVLMRTSWSDPFKPNKPDEMVDQSNKAEKAIRESRWPKEEAEKYPLVDTLGQEVKRMTSPVALSRFAYSTPMTFPLYVKEEPIKEPTWIPVQQLMAGTHRTLFEMRSKDRMMEGMPGTPGGMPDAFGPIAGGGRNATGRTTAPGEDNIPDQFRTKNTGGGAFGPGAGPAGPIPGGVGPGGRIPGGGPRPAALPDAGRTAPAGGGRRGASPMPLPGDMAGMMPGAEGSMGAAGVEGKGKRYASITGVFPIRQQLDLVAKALNMPEGDPRIADLVQFIDFKLQRKRAVAGDAPWSGPWVDVNLKSAVEFMEQVEDFDEDVVDITITDPVLTMPLPRRIVGIWNKEATHPDVERFRLSAEGQKLQSMLKQQIVAEAESIQASRQNEVEKRGFALIQRDYRRDRSDVLTGSPGAVNNVIRDVKDRYDPGSEQKNVDQQIADMITAAGSLVLFRYFDFDVEPGNAYIYRVRVTFTNPNYNRPVEELAHGHQGAALEKVRLTPWSNLTEPVIVPNDVDYFLAQIDSTRLRGFQSATLEIFEWSEDLGTTNNAKLKNQFGQFIGGKVKVEVLNPAKETFEKEDVSFQTNDVLLDAVDLPKFDKEDLTLLGLPERYRGKVQIADQALIVNGSGELVPLNSVSRKPQQDFRARMLEYERKPFEWIKEQQKEGEGGGAGALAEATAALAGPAGEGPMGRGRGNAKKPKNALRKNIAPGAMMEPPPAAGGPAPGRGRPNRR